MSGTHRGQKKPSRAKRSKPRKGVDPSVKTARNTRRLHTTGTVETASAQSPHADHHLGALDGPSLFADLNGVDKPHETARRAYTRIDDRDVLRVRKMVRASGVVTFLEAKIAAAKEGHHSGGRRARVTIEALVVAMLLAAMTEKPMLLTVFRDILFYSISKNMRRMLNVADGVTPRTPIPSKRRRWNKTAVKAVGETFHRMCAVIDPSDEITPRKQVKWEQIKFRGLTDEEMQTYQAHLDWVVNQILLATYMTLPASVRAHDHGDRCIDGSDVRQFTRRRNLDDPEAMSMPHAANYTREGAHFDPDEEDPDRPKVNVVILRTHPALEMHTMTASDTTPGLRQYFPNGLVTSLTVERPGMDPSGCARRLIAVETDRKGFQPRYITGDGLYVKAEESTFQIPARKKGFKPILPILPSASGVQGAHASGFPWVDGTGCCPAIPADLRTIVQDWREGRIDSATRDARLKARRNYELATKQNADANGIGERVGCRAANHSLTVMCPLKPASMVERPTRNRDGDLEDNRLLIEPPSDIFVNGRPPTICQVQTVTLNPSDHAKFRQSIPIGDEHTDIFNLTRQSQEGTHGFAKDDAKEALAAPGRRRVRTRVAQELFIGCLVAAANLRRIVSFIERCLTDEHGDFYVPRKPRDGEHARTGRIPGTPWPRKGRARDPAA